MERRRFVGVVLASAAITSTAARGQAVRQRPRLGVLATIDIPYVNEALRQGLREYGYIEGQNIELEYRSAGGNIDRLSALAKELLGLNVDLLVTMDSSAARAAKQATTTLPIVMAPAGNPVEGGLVASLSRPGGNLTGVSTFSLDLAGKRMGLLKELLPRAERVAVLMATTSSAPALMMDLSRAAARDLGVNAQFVTVAVPADIDRAFEAMKQGRADGFVAFPSPIFNSERPKLAELAQRYRLPAVGEAREFAVAGFVLGYGPSIADLARRSAFYVDRILKGMRPSELPVEQPAKFDMTINLRAARAIGVTVPQALILRADDVIQ